MIKTKIMLVTACALGLSACGDMEGATDQLQEEEVGDSRIDLVCSMELLQQQWREIGVLIVERGQLEGGAVPRQGRGLAAGTNRVLGWQCGTHSQPHAERTHLGG